MKLKQSFSEWVMVIVQVTLISLFIFALIWLAGKMDTWDQKPTSKTEYEKWHDKWFDKCYYVIRGNVYLENKKMECWYRGQLIFTETYDGKD
jgi:hypothetical protein